MADPKSEPTDKPTRRGLISRCVPRWSAPTWRIVLLAAVVFFFVEVPGRRTGPASYAHGWPFVYMEREYLGDPAFQSIEFENDSAWWGGRNRGSEWRKHILEEWADGHHIPYGFELALTPWSFNHLVHWTQAAADIAFAILSLYLLGQIVQLLAWRRKPRSRFFQFRLRTLLAAFLLAAVACSLLMSWRRDYLAEQRALAITKAGQYSYGAQLQLAYYPPEWLPECLLKLGIQSWFVRVHFLAPENRLEGRLDVLSSFKELRGLRCRVETPQDVAYIAGLKSLKELQTEGPALDASAIRQFSRLPHLQSVLLEGIHLDDAALAELNGLKSLEEVTLDRTAANIIDLHGLPRLKRFELNANGGLFRASPFNDDTSNPLPETASMNLAELPPDKLWRPVIRFADLPRLEEVQLSYTAIDQKSIDDLARLPSMKRLIILDSRPSGAESRLEVASFPNLTDLCVNGAGFTSIAIRDMPEMLDLQLDQLPDLRELELSRIGTVTHLTLMGCPWLHEISLSDLPRLEEFSIDNSQHDQRMWGNAPPAPLLLRRLEGVPQLELISLPGRRLDRETFARIGRLGKLRRLLLDETWTDDKDLEQLRGLKTLEECSLSFTNITEAGLRWLADLPRLQQLSIGGSLVRPSSPVIESLRPRIPDYGVPMPYPVEVSAAAARANPLAFWDGWRHDGRFCNYDLEGLAAFSGLQAINLWGAHLTDAGLTHLKNFPDLRALNLAESRITDAGLKELAALSSLEALGLADTIVTGVGLQDLAALPKLRAIDLGECELTDDGLKNLALLPNLQTLRLTGPRITDAQLVYLAPLKKLRWLDLSGTSVTDAGLARLSELPALRTLLLRECSAIHGSGLGSLSRLPSLSKLDLRNDALGPVAFDGLAKIATLSELDLRAPWLPAQPNNAIDWKRLARCPNLRTLFITVAEANCEKDSPSVGDLHGLTTLGIEFPEGQAAPGAPPSKEEAAVLDALKQLTPTATNVVTLPDEASEPDAFWASGFDRDAIGQPRSKLKKPDDAGPITPHEIGRHRSNVSIF